MAGPAEAVVRAAGRIVDAEMDNVLAELSDQLRLLRAHTEELHGYLRAAAELQGGGD